MRDEFAREGAQRDLMSALEEGEVACYNLREDVSNAGRRLLVWMSFGVA